MTASGQDSSPRQSLRGTTRSTGEWHIYTAIYDHKRSEVYVDGARAGHPAFPSIQLIKGAPIPSPVAGSSARPASAQPPLSACFRKRLNSLSPPVGFPCRRRMLCRILRRVRQERGQQRLGRPLRRLRSQWRLLPDRLPRGAPPLPLPHQLRAAHSGRGSTRATLRHLVFITAVGAPDASAAPFALFVRPALAPSYQRLRLSGRGRGCREAHAAVWPWGARPTCARVVLQRSDSASSTSRAVRELALVLPPGRRPREYVPDEHVEHAGS